MTTPTPTGSPEAQPITEQVQPGALLDPRALTLLANQMFQGLEAPADLVTQERLASSPFSLPAQQGGIPSVPQANVVPVATSLTTPSLAPPVAASLPAATTLLLPPAVLTPRIFPAPSPTPGGAAFQPGFESAIPRGLGVAKSPHSETVPAATRQSELRAGAPSAAIPGPTGTPTADAFYFAPAQRGETAVPQTPSFEADHLAGRRLEPSAAEPREPASGSTSTRNAPTFYFLDPPASGAQERASSPGRGVIDVHALRRDFPMLREQVNGHPLVWFDNAATTQKPQSVIDRVAYFYEHENSNIHRGAHSMAARATDAYEAARDKVARYLGASSSEEIIFVRGATEGINLVARTWGIQNLRAGDEIVLSHLEHHANIVPWQMVASETGARLRIIPVDDSGQVRLDEYQKLLGHRTRIVAVTHVSNALGTVVPIAEIIDMGHRAGAKVLIDGAQSVSHFDVDVRVLDADFFVFSGHKVFGPTGIGAVYGKRELLEAMPPYHGGGNMISDVTFDKTVYQPAPARFEAGTGSIADAVGLGEALDYVERLGLENIARYEHDLLRYALDGLCSVNGLHLIGTAAERTSAMSFVLDGFAPDEVAGALNQEGMAVRAGHHCAQPILRRLGVEATVRPSLAFYNTQDEVDLLVTTLKRLSSSRGTHSRK